LIEGAAFALPPPFARPVVLQILQQFAAVLVTQMGTLASAFMMVLLTPSGILGFT